MLDGQGDLASIALANDLTPSDQPLSVQTDQSFSVMTPAQKLVNYSLALLLLTFLAVPFALIALAIKLDSDGPVFFLQPRIGFRNKVFHIWKFRTMYRDRCDHGGCQLTLRNDPRVTRLGALLRHWSIDELPQLFNVLSGEMALVGPRPHAIEAKVGERFYAEIVPSYHERHAVLPGITGWAQVNGWRGETIVDRQIEQRVRYDLEYIEKRSAWFDLRIIALTAIRYWHNAGF